MPEHDLLMQINKSMNFLCTQFGRVEQKVDDLNAGFHTHCASCDNRLEALEKDTALLKESEKKRTGIAVGITIIINALAWFVVVITGWFR